MYHIPKLKLEFQIVKQFEIVPPILSFRFIVILIVYFVVSSLVRKLKQQAREQMEERRPNLVAALNQMGDFYMELKWDFQSWGEYKR